MSSLADLADSRRPAFNFRPQDIQIKPDFNCRDFSLQENIDHVRSITDSIKASGFDPGKPLTVYKDGDIVYLSDGECRHRAVLLAIAEGAPIETIPCLPEASGTDAATRTLNQVRANSAKRFSLSEEGLNFSRAIAFGKSIEDIAAYVSRSDTHVRNALDFHAAPPEVKTLVADGKVSAKTALATVRSEGADAATTTLTEAVEQKGGKVRPRDLNPPPAPSVKAFIKKLGKRKDPLEADDFDEEIRTFSEIVKEARVLAKTL
jgi:ParB family chromosome partitioning protein